MILADLKRHVSQHLLCPLEIVCTTCKHSVFLACKGDSGGPLSILDINGDRVLIGIVMQGTDCDPDFASTFVYIPQFRGWIKEVTGI